MKKLFFLFIMFLFIPLLVSASDMSINELTPKETIFFKDTRLVFYKSSYVPHFYLNNVSVDDDIYEDPNYKYYNIPENVILKSSSLVIDDSDHKVLTVYLETINLPKIHCFIDGKSPDEIPETNYYFEKKYCDDYIETGKYYSSKDLYLLYSPSSHLNFYDKEGELVDFDYSQSMYFPKLNDKETYWVYTGTVNNGYNYYISPVFEEYIPPKFEFKCNPKTIKYGEKTVCTLYATADLDLRNVNFNLDSKEYKVLSATFPKGIENKKGDKQYNLEIDEELKQEDSGFVLGTFEITGAQNKEYNNQVQVVDIDFIDEKVSAKYDNLEDPIEIVALNDKVTEEKNPVTASKSIIIPIVIFIVAFILYFVFNKKRKEVKSVS